MIGKFPRWGLYKAKANNLWMTYMSSASTHNAAMYGRLMAYLKFLSPSDDARCSSNASDQHLGYWYVIVEISERVDGLPEVLDHDDDGHSSCVLILRRRR
jgi:hypothetical protein